MYCLDNVRPELKISFTMRSLRRIEVRGPLAILTTEEGTRVTAINL